MVTYNLTKVASFRSGQRKTFTMWANSKLIAAGHDPIRNVDKMADSFRDGVVLSYLMQYLSEKNIRGIETKPRNPLHNASNMQILWKFIHDDQGIDTGGINPNDILGGNEKIVLALMWRLICKYDIDDEHEDLLDWVQPRTADYADVQNFDKSWKSGMAFLALFNSIRPGVIDMDAMVEDADNVEEHLAMAFELFEEHLGVCKFLEVNDMMVTKPEKRSVMTYVAAIRHAAIKDEELQKKAQQDANAGHKGKGDELYNTGVARFVQASADDESLMDDILNDVTIKLEDSDGTDEAFDAITEECMETLKQATERYDAANSKFEEAKGEYSQVDDGSCEEQLSNCDAKTVEVDKHKRELEEALLTALKNKVKNAKGKKKLGEANEQLENAIGEGGQALEEALSVAYEKIAAAKNESERIAAANEAKEKVKGKTAIFSEVKETFEEAEKLLQDEEPKTEAVQKAIQCDELARQLLEALDSKLTDAINAAPDAEELSDADLLALYHDFSLEVEGMLDTEDSGEKATIDRAQGAARSRLDGISTMLKALKSKDAGMRAKLHAMIDASFDAE